VRTFAYPVCIVLYFLGLRFRNIPKAIQPFKVGSSRIAL